MGQPASAKFGLPTAVRGDPLSMSDQRDEMAPGDEAPPQEPTAADMACEDCDGTGEIDGQTCPSCEGSGLVEEGVGGG